MNDSPPDNLLKWRNRERAAFASGNWAELANALAAQAAIIAAPSEKAGTLYRAGRAAETAPDYEKALELFRQVKGDLNWERAARFNRLEIHWRRSEWEPLVSVLDEEMAQSQGEDSKTLRLEKSRILALRMGMVDEAVSELTGIISEDPACREAIWLLLVLALRSGDWDRVAKQYTRLFELASSDNDPAFIQSCALRLAQISELRFNNPEDAGTWYEKIDNGQASALSRVPLFEIAEGKKDWQSAANILSSLISTLESESQEIPSSLRLVHARILEDGIGDREGAGREIKAILEKTEDDFPALLSAVERAMESGAPEVRADLDAKICGLLEDKQEIAFFTADRVRVLLEDLNDLAGAKEAAGQWMEAAPDDLSAGRWLIESLIRANENEEAMALIEQELSRTSDQREQQGLLFKKAELAAHKLGDQKAALNAYQRALEIPPSQFPILQAMARLYHLDHDYENLARVLSAIMKLVQDPPLAKYYKSWVATLFLERLSRDDQAFALFGEILKADPADRASLKVIARISRKNESWPNLAGALSRISDTTDDPNLKAEIKARMAWLYEIKLDQKDKAGEIYRELAAGGHGFALESVRRLSYLDHDFKSYSETYESLAGQSSQGSLRASRLVRLGAAREILGDLSESWAAYEKARASLMEQPHLFLPMIDLAQLSGYWTRYMSLIDEFAARLGDPCKKSLLWESAWSRSEIPGSEGQIDAAAMLRSFKGLIEISDGDQGALRGALLASIWAGDHRERAEVLVRMIKQADEDQALVLRTRLAYVLRDELGASQESIAALKQVLAKEPKSTPVIRELQLMYEQAEQWGELIRMMLQEMPLRQEPEVQVDMYSELAKLYEEKFQAFDESIKCHQAVLRIVPDRPQTHRELIRLLEAGEKWEELVVELLAFEQVTAETEDKIKLFDHAATICDQKLSDANRAIENLKKALDLDPTRMETISRLEGIYEREERWQELTQVLIGHAERIQAPAQKATLHERVAGIFEERLSDIGQAIGHLITARDLDPERQSVLLSLERLFTSSERWEELIDTLERLAKPGEAEDKIGYFSRIGALWDEKLSRTEESIASWERVRELDSGNVPAHEALVSLYERTNNDQLFVERAAALAELVADDKARAVDLLCSAGSAMETKLSDDEQGLGLYHRAMEIDASSVKPVAAARAVRERREEWAEVAKLWLREEQITDDASRKLEIFTEAGKIYEIKLEDPASASGAYERALTLSGDYLPAATPLSEIYFKQETWDKARPLFEIRTGAISGEPAPAQAEVWHKAGWCAEQAKDVEAAMARYHSSVEAVPEYRLSLERLSELYTNQKKWDKASEFTDRLLTVVKAAQDTEAAFILLSRQGMIEDKLERLDRATSAYEQALQIKPGDYETLTHLVDIYTRQEDWRKILVAYDQLIQNAPSPEVAGEGLVGKGCVLEDKLSEEQSALAHFQKAVEVAPSNLTGWDRLATIYLRRKAWPEAERALTQLLQLENIPVRLVEHHYNLGSVYLEGMEDLSRAREQFEAALAIDEVHVPSMQSLGDIYLKLEEWQKYIETSEKFVKLVPEDNQASLVPLYVKLGEVYRDHTDQTERAIINFKEAIKFDPDNEEIRSGLAAIYVSDPKFIDQAKEENRNLIRMQPFRVQTYRDLSEIYKNQGNLDAQFYLYSVLSLTGSLEYDEEVFYEANLDKVPKTSNKSLKILDRESHLIHPDARGPLRDMLITMGDYLGKLFAPPLTKYGAKKNNRLTADSVSPIKDMAAEMAVNLGLEDLDIYLITQNIEPQVIHTSPPSLLINTDWFNRFNPKEQRFLMGRLMEQLINRYGLLAHYPADQVVQTLCLLAKASGADIGVIPGLSPQEADKKVKSVRKLIPRKLKSEVEHASQRFSQEVLNTDPAKWKKAFEHTANRAGLLVTGDLPSAFGAMIKTNPDFKSLKYEDLGDKIQIWEKDKDVIELMTFVASDPYFLLRKRLGYSIT